MSNYLYELTFSTLKILNEFLFSGSTVVYVPAKIDNTYHHVIPCFSFLIVQVLDMTTMTKSGDCRHNIGAARENCRGSKQLRMSWHYDLSRRYFSL